MALKSRLAKRSFELNTSAAFHSRLMNSATKQLKELLERTHFSTPKATLISNVTGETVDSSDERLQTLLLRQLTCTVNWLGCMDTVMKRKLPVIEIGPKPVLSTLMKRHGIEDVSFYSGE